MTLLELIQKTTSYFEKAGVPTPRLDTELLVAHVLQMQRMQLYLQFERVLTEKELDQLRPLVKRRASREPLQHLVGTVEFHGIELNVGPEALIPRPETELLAETAIQLIRDKADARVLDLCTGTGALALSLSRALSQIKCIATDISEDALKLAQSNAQKLELQSRVEFRKGDLFAPIKPEETFDLIVSNPPYIPSVEIPKLQPEVQKDPLLALDGGVDGLDLIRKIITDAPKFLKDSGWFVMEMGEGQSLEVCELLKVAGFTHVEIGPDLQKIPRIARAQLHKG
jgi:release factor glutamine methyltransferase